MSQIQVTENLVLTVHKGNDRGGPAVVIHRTDSTDEELAIYAREIRHLVAKLPEAAVQMVDGVISVDGIHSGDSDGCWTES